MNPNTPYNTGVLQNMVTKVKAYCAHIIPLVFDNTLSYYESICACVGKVNELCDAVNAQNLTIVEFTHLVEVELDKLSKYIDEQITSFDTRITANEENIHTLTVRTDNQELVLQNIGEWREWANRQLSDIRDILATCLKQTDITDTITDGDTTHVPTADAVYDAIQNATGVTVRDAQANPTHGTIKGIVTTDFQHIANPLSITNGVMSMREATKNVTGYVQVGDNINVTNGVIDVPLASPTAKGLVMASNVDSGLTAYNGTLRVNLADPLYIDTHHNRVEVKHATNTQLGVVAPKLGGALDIQSAGEIDAKYATTTQKGVVTLTDTITDGDTSHVPTADAVYQAIQGGGAGSVPDATVDVKGKVKPGAGLTIATATPGVITLNTATRNVIGGVKIGDGLKNDTNDKLTIDSDATLAINQSGKLTVRTATPDNVGLTTIDGTNSNLTMSYGKIDVPTGSRSTKGVLQVGSNINVGNGVISVPTATPGTLGVATIADTGSNLTMGAGGVIDVPTGSLSTKGVLKVNNSNGLTVSDGTVGINRADEVTWGTVRIGDNIISNNGEISVSDASINTAGVVMLDDTVTQSSTNVPTSDAVYNAIASMLQNGGFSRTLVLEGNSNPNSGAECFLVYDSGTTVTTPTASNIVNSGNIPTRAKPTSTLTGGNVHIFVRLDLLPSNLNYNQQMQIITLEAKQLTIGSLLDAKYVNGFIPWGYSPDTTHSYAICNSKTWNVGDTYTDSNNVQYRHIYVTADGGNSGFSVNMQFRVKIDL